MQSQKDVCFLFKNNTLLRIELPFDPTVLPLGIHPGEMKKNTRSHKHQYTDVLRSIIRNS